MPRHSDRLDPVKTATAHYSVRIAIEWRGPYASDNIAKEIGRDMDGTIRQQFRDFIMNNKAHVSATIVKE